MTPLSLYGIKEVMDVTFYSLNQDGTPDKPVLVLDTLKISNLEETSEQVDAKGGKGNASYIVWDFGKEITLTLQDALFSPKSLALMHGVKDISDTPATIQRTVRLVCTENGVAPNYKENINGEERVIESDDLSYYDADGNEVETYVAGETYFATWDEVVVNDNVDGYELEINADTFPGTYYITGTTYARDEVSGEDQFFDIIIPKAKINSNTTISMQAEGDPSVFDMTIKVLRPQDRVMVKLIQVSGTLYSISQYGKIKVDYEGNQVKISGINAGTINYRLIWWFIGEKDEIPVFPEQNTDIKDYVDTYWDDLKFHGTGAYYMDTFNIDNTVFPVDENSTVTILILKPAPSSDGGCATIVSAYQRIPC